MLKRFFILIKKSFEQWNEDKAPRLGAALAFYSVLSLSPLIVLVLAAMGLFFDTNIAQDKILGEIKNLIGNDGTIAIKEVLRNAALQKDTGIISSILGIGALLFGASGVFGELKDSMNTIWNIKKKPHNGFIVFMISRFFSIAMVLGTIFLLLSSRIISAFIDILMTSTQNLIHNAYTYALISQLNVVVSFVITTFLFAIIFKYLPDTDVKWKDVGVGALMTSILFSLGKFLIGLYLAHSSFSSSYGAAGSLVVVLIWIYYSSQILFFGAEFTQVYSKHSSRR